MDKCAVNPDGWASFFVCDKWLKLRAPHVGLACGCGVGLSVFVGVRGFEIGRRSLAFRICQRGAGLFVIPAAFDLAFVLFRLHCGEEFGCLRSRV